MALCFLGLGYRQKLALWRLITETAKFENYKQVFLVWKCAKSLEILMFSYDVQNRWKFIKTWLLKIAINLFQKFKRFEAKRRTSNIFQKSHTEGFGSITLLIMKNLQIERK